MSEPFALTTCDPRFDPREPVEINGYRFAPAPRARGISDHWDETPEILRDGKGRD